MTNQEVFDKVVSHLRAQYSKAFLPDSTECAYRAEDGKKCAVGCLIKDEYYSTNMERMSSVYPIVIDALYLSGVYENAFPYHGLDTQMLLSRLQTIHDKYYVEDWEEYFEDCARTFHLFYTKK